jgi:hypothetical protein
MDAEEGQDPRVAVPGGEVEAERNRDEREDEHDGRRKVEAADGDRKGIGGGLYHRHGLSCRSQYI